MNTQGTSRGSVTVGLPKRPLRFQLIGPDGFIEGSFANAQQAVAAAQRYWPGVEQDEDREGWGWDIEVIRP